MQPTIKMEDKAKSIKILLDYSDENGVRSKKEMSVKINTAVLKDKTQNTFFKPKLVYSVSFSLRIPDHIHSFLLGKTVPAFGISRTTEKIMKQNFQRR